MGGDDCRHLKKVLRASVGTRVGFSDNAGCRYLARVAAIRDKHMVLSVTSRYPVEKEIPRVLLFQCILKKNAMELLIQKACEIGAEAIVPVYSRRVVAGKGKLKTARWQKIARQACMQSKRNFLTEIRDPVDISGIKPGQFDFFLLPYEQEGSWLKFNIGPEIKKLACLIGPEGGFEEQEVDMLKKQGARVLNFGKNILRAETAALYMLSVIDYLAKNETE